MTAPASAKMPVVFSAHGSPMNAVRENAFTRFLTGWGGRLTPPRAILAVSAHWESRGLAVTSSARPETIHDFHGFPEELYALRYPAPGSPDLAARVIDLLAAAGLDAAADPRRGLDHGVWAPLLRAWPRGDVPVVALSLLHDVPLAKHVEVGRALRPLRDEGVLIFGSGNVVHNLATADLSRENLPPEPWAAAFDAWVKERLDARAVEALASFRDLAPHGRIAHPSVEHYAPLLVAAAAAGDSPSVAHPFEGFEHGTISLRCVEFA